ncbi:MAG: FAD-binding domain-containing protein [Devosiaceae bacterium]
MMPDRFPVSRAAALERLTKFAPKAGRAYAANRNTDFGASTAQGVSMLSPYLKRHMITEREVVEATLAQHSPEAAEKFIQEVYWRTYWKGWLEMRPSLWDHYLQERENGFRDLDKDGALRRDYAAAIEGRTGIEGFDDWAHELVETGWLHNHARMWFASIWVFTLRLPWALGADFFYSHLLDADPASNTLSWRWVAGLHTKGKTYLARADNIEKFTNGRFRPTGLAPFAEPLIENFDIPSPLPPREAHARVPDGDYALLLTSDDLHPESWPGYDANPPKLVICVAQVSQEADLNAGEIAREFTIAALDETASRLGIDTATCEPTAEALAALIRDKNLACLGHAFANSGPTHAFLNQVLVKIHAENIALHEMKRSWDNHAWPHATAGFFKMKKKIPKLMAQAGLVG